MKDLLKFKTENSDDNSSNNNRSREFIDNKGKKKDNYNLPQIYDTKYNNLDNSDYSTKENYFPISKFENNAKSNNSDNLYKNQLELYNNNKYKKYGKGSPSNKFIYR